MSAPTTPQQALDQATLGPKSVRVGNEEVVQRDLKELREQRNDAAAQTAGSLANFGLRFTKLVPPGGG